MRIIHTLYCYYFLLLKNNNRYNGKIIVPEFADGRAERSGPVGGCAGPGEAPRERVVAAGGSEGLERRGGGEGGAREEEGEGGGEEWENK